jgi:ankyrin repeat protein
MVSFSKISSYLTWQRIRWVDCQIQYLLQLGTKRAIKKALKRLPSTLEETYVQALNSTKLEHREDVQAILKWLLFGYNDLTLDMVPELLCINVQEQSLDIPEPVKKNDIASIVNSTLVVVEPINRWSWRRGETVLQLAHPSVKEYILSEEIKSSSASLFYVNDQLGHAFIAQSCLVYLLHCEKEISIEYIDSPFLKYGAKEWPRHYKNVHELEDGVKFLSRNLFSNENGAYDFWSETKREFEHRQLMPPLQHASELGLIDVVQLELEKGAEVNAQAGEYGTVLQAASYGGHKDMVEFLLEKGADVNLQGGHCDTTLQVASWIGHKDIVELLLEKGADVNLQGGHYDTALQAASYRGYKNIVELLLEKGADVNLQGGQYDTALQAASFGGHKDIVELLLQKGASINAEGGRFSTALQACALRFQWPSSSSERFLETAKLLLENGANVDVQGGKYGTLIEIASEYKDKTLYNLLIDGAKVDSISNI